MEKKIRILFICFGNVCRSAMAEKIVNKFHGEIAVADSAGTDQALPLIFVDDSTIKAMEELGLDKEMVSHTAKHVGEVTDSFDFVINMSPESDDVLKNAFSNLQSAAWLNWRVRDPRGQTKKVYQRVRDQLKEQIEEFFEELASIAVP